MPRRWLLTALVVVLGCSSDEFSAVPDATSDVVVPADAAPSDATPDAPPPVKCASYAGPGFCDDFDTVKDGAAELDPRWTMDNTKGFVTRSSSQSKSAPESALANLQAGFDGRAALTYHPNVAIANHVLQQFSVRVDGASCGTKVDLVLAGLSGFNANATGRVNYALRILSGAPGGPKLQLLAAISDLDGGNASLPAPFLATKVFPFDAWVDVVVELYVKSPNLVRVLLRQGVDVVVDQTVPLAIAVYNPTYSIGLASAPRSAACTAFFDDVVLEATQ